MNMKRRLDKAEEELKELSEEGQAPEDQKMETIYTEIDDSLITEEDDV